VTERTRPHSGSRWEPATPPPGYSPAPSPSVAAPGTPRRLPSRLRRRGALAGAAIGLVALSGLGGYAVGHDASQTDPAQAGVVQPGDGDGATGPDDGGGDDG
jgi:hypothetical protein